MTKQQILVLYSLGVGFIIIVILIAGLLVSNNKNLSEFNAPTLVPTIVLYPGSQSGSAQDGAPVGMLDGDHTAGSEPSDSVVAGAIPTLSEDQVLPANPDGSGGTPAAAAGAAPADSSGMGAYPAPGTEDSSVPLAPPPSDSQGVSPAPTDQPPAEPADSGGQVPPPVDNAPAAPTEAPTQPVVPNQPAVPTLAAAPTAAPAPTVTPQSAAPAPTQAQPTQAQPTQAQPTQAQPTQAQPTEQPAGNVLVSVPAAAAPALDGAAGDPAWAGAPAVTVQTSGGANHSATQVTVKSVYAGDRVYFLFTWADPSQSFLRQPWEKQADGLWKRLTSANGNDENQYYEDKLALIWPINRSLPDFDARGCAGACHEGENAKAKPYGNMYTGGSNQDADLWQWKAARNAGQVDDQYLDSQKYSSNNPAAGFHPDPSDGGGYRENQNKDKTAPEVMAPGGGDRSGAPGFINEAEKVALDPNLFQPGNRVPSVIKSPFKGDRGDISAAWTYANGQWTLELSRKLVTGSKYDVQFKRLDQTYAFALATFDNAQVRHAVESGATLLKFQH